MMPVYEAQKSRVRCPCCERPVCIRLDGRLTKHRLDGWDSTICQGTDSVAHPVQPPWPHIPSAESQLRAYVHHQLGRKRR